MGAISIEGERYDMEAGDVLLCEPREVHEVPTVEEGFFIILKIDSEHDDTVWIEKCRRATREI